MIFLAFNDNTFFIKCYLDVIFFKYISLINLILTLLKLYTLIITQISKITNVTYTLLMC